MVGLMKNLWTNNQSKIKHALLVGAVGLYYLFLMPILPDGLEQFRYPCAIGCFLMSICSIITMQNEVTNAH